MSNILDPDICIMGDFNVVLGAHYRSSWVLSHALPTEEFREFISSRDLFDIEIVVNKYTWSRRLASTFIAIPS